MSPPERRITPPETVPCVLASDQPGDEWVYSLLLGKHINMSRARRAAKAADEAQRIRDTVKNMDPTRTVEEIATGCLARYKDRVYLVTDEYLGDPLRRLLVVHGGPAAGQGYWLRTDETVELIAPRGGWHWGVPGVEER